MKIKTIILISIVCMFFGINGFPQEKAGQPGMPEDQKNNTFRTEKIIGSRVVNAKGEKIGLIKDLIVDIDTGNVVYAVLDFEGSQEIGNKFFPVPWKSLSVLPPESVFFLDRSKERLEKPQYINRKNNLPDIEEMPRRTKINKIYQAQREERGDDMSYGYTYAPSSNQGDLQQDFFANVFDSGSIKKFNGQIIKVEKVIPGLGNISQKYVELIVYIDRKETVPVYLGPEWYVGGSGQRNMFKNGDYITITGSWITSDDSPFVIASAVTKGDRTLQLRDREGIPVW